MIKAIVFDAYGTLIDTGTGSVDAAKEILKNRGRTDISASDFYADWKKHHRKHIDSLTEFVTEEEIFCSDLRSLYKKYGIDGDADRDVQIMLETLGKRKAFPETLAVLALLSEKYPLYIGSTSDTYPLMQDIKNNRICVNRVYTSESLRVYKPEPEFYRAIASDIGVNCENVLFVGDSPVDDVFGPKRVGMKACLVDRKQRDLRGITPEYTVKSLNELSEIL